MKEHVTLMQGDSFEIGGALLTVVSIGMTKQDRTPARRHVEILIEPNELNEADPTTETTER